MTEATWSIRLQEAVSRVRWRPGSDNTRSRCRGRLLAARQPRGQAVCSGREASLPSRSPDHPQFRVPGPAHGWTRCSSKIAREGEDRATIDEIIRLSRKYKFVTPYTSFLAVPRALLRPRVIRPGDPVLRVRTDTSIVSVTALFPFGLIKPLRHLADEDIWQTRFLAPADMSDGTYRSGSSCGTATDTCIANPSRS